MADIFDKIEQKQDIFDQIEQQPQETALQRAMQPSLFGPLGQAWQALPSAVRKGIGESGIVGPLGTELGQKVASAPFKVARTATEYTQEQAKRIPAIEKFYQQPAGAMSIYGPLGSAASLFMSPEQRESVATGTISELGGVYGGGELYRLGAKTISGITKTPNIIKKMVRGVRRYKAPAKLRPTERVKFLEVRSRLKHGEPITKAKERIQKISWDRADTRQQFQQISKQTDMEIKRSIIELDKDIQRAAESGSLKFQKKLPNFFKKNSEAYSQRLDEVSEALANSSKGRITKGEFRSIITRTIKESDELLVNSGKPYDTLRQLESKYGNRIDKLGNIVDDSASSVNFREVVNDTRKVAKAISGPLKRGTGKFTSEDISSAIFKKNWGEWVGINTPEFQALNQSYKPVIQAMKESSRIFKPYGGEFSTKAGTQFLKKLGKGKLEAGELRLLKTLEEGTEFSPGVGKVGELVQQYGEKKTTQVLTNELKRIARQNELSARMGQFQQEERALRELVRTEGGVLQGRLNQLTTRREHVMKLMANKDKAIRLRRILLRAGLIAAGGYYGLSRLIRGQNPVGGYGGQ